MEFTIIIVLIVVLVLFGVTANAIEQYKNKVETERRTKLSKQKSIIENTEAALMSAEQLPISQRLIFIMQHRILAAMKAAKMLDDKTTGYNDKIKTTEDSLKNININTSPPSDQSFQLPHADKQVIQFIRSIKTLRSLLRSDYRRNRIESSIFLAEDKLLERLLLRANIDKLMRRSDTAVKNNQAGSARQSLEKAIGALSALPNPDEFITATKAQLEEKLQNIESSLKKANSRDVAKKEELEKNVAKKEESNSDGLENLFAEKKKW